MKNFRAIAALALLFASPAAGDVAFVGDPKLGLEAQDAEEKCAPAEIEPDKCIRESSENKFGTGMTSRNLPNGIKISGEASMGLVYDGEDFGIQNDVSIHIHFETSIDSGFSAGGGISLSSEQTGRN